MYQYFKRQWKTSTCFGSFGIHPQGVLNVLHWNYVWCFVCVVGVWQREIWTVIRNGMSNFNGIVPKLLTWIIIDDTHTTQGKSRSTSSIIIQVSNFGTILYEFDIPFRITVQISRCQTPTTHTKHHK